MSGTVIRFPVRPNSCNQDPRDDEQRVKSRDLSILRVIEQRASDKTGSGLLRFRTWQDVFIARRAIDELVLKARNSGTPVGEIKAKFPKIDRYRLSAKYALADSATEQYVRKTSTESVRPYIFAARAIAAATKDAARNGAQGFESDDCVLEVLRNTKLFQHDWGVRGGSRSGSEPNEPAYHLTTLLHELSGRVIRDTRLADLFERMRLTPGVWDMRQGAFRYGATACLLRPVYTGGYEAWEEAAPLPSIPMLRIWQAGYRLPAVLCRATSDVPSTQELFQPPSFEASEGEEFQAELHVSREIRLALGPTTSKETLGPLFESRAFIEITLFDEHEAPGVNAALDPSYSLNVDRFGIQIDGKWRELLFPSPVDTGDLLTVTTPLGTPVDHPLFWECQPLERDISERQKFEHHYISWTPVDAAHVHHWLGRLDSETDALIAGRTAGLAYYPSIYPAYRLGAAIQDGSLATALKDSIDHLRSAFEVFEADWKERLRVQTSAQVADFNNDLAAEG